MKKIFYLSLLLLSNKVIIAQINLASGTTGTITNVAQSFNETRGVDAQVIVSHNINIQSMTLGGFFCGDSNGEYACLDARIYNSSTSALMAVSARDTALNIYDGNVTVPISCTLASGGTYRICFSCSGPNPPTDNSGLMFQPQFPYTESSHLLQIISAWDGSIDTIPLNTNIDVPLITLNLAETGVNEIDLENLISVYPNPANGVFNFKMSTPITSGIASAQMKIYNVYGECIHEEASMSSNFQIDLSSQPNGIYFLRLKASKGTAIKKMIINK